MVRQSVGWERMGGGNFSSQDGWPGGGRGEEAVTAMTGEETETGRWQMHSVRQAIACGPKFAPARSACRSILRMHLRVLRIEWSVFNH